MTAHQRSATQTPLRGITVTIEGVVTVLLVMVAFGLRALALGNTPLSASEAEQAAAAASTLGLGISAGGHVSSVLLYVLSLVSFLLAGASNGVARIWPMLAGVALVFAPLLFRRQFGRLPTVIAAAFLAISPVAVSASRRLNGAGLSMLALLIALALIDRYLRHQNTRNLYLLGAALGLALLADYGTWVAALTLIAGFGFAVLSDEEDLLTPDRMSAALRLFHWGPVVIALLLTIGGLGTAFFTIPGGIGEAATQITDFLRGFAHRLPGVIYPGLGLAIYQPGLLVFGLYGTWLASQSPSPRERLLAGWGMAGIIAVLGYSGARPEHILWAVVPLALLAGLGIESLLSRPHLAPRWGIWLQAILYLALAAMIWAGLAHHLTAPRLLTLPANAPPDQITVSIPLDLVLVLLWLILLGAVVMAGTSFWGTQAAIRGAALAALLLSGALALGQSAALAWMRSTSPYEPANVSPSQPGLDRLTATAREVGDLALGYPYDVQLVIESSTGLLPIWALRDFHDTRVVERADPTVDSIMVVTTASDAEIPLGSDYVGQDFVIAQSWSPAALSLADALKWIMYRTAPTPPADQRVILWVREDVFRLVSAGGQPAQP